MIYTVQTYDNMDRTTKTEKFLLVPNTGSGSGSSSYGSGTGGTQIPKINTNNPADDILLARTEIFYDPRGKIWKTEQSVVNPANGAVQGKLLGQTWYDPKGRVIKKIELGANAFTKYVYDSLGRIVKTYFGLDTTESGYAAATNVTGDTVFAQSETTYDNLGNMLVSTQIERLSTASGTGALLISTGRYQSTAMWYDGAGRQIARANYGTNGGSILTRPVTVPTRSDTCLVTEMKYDTSAGRAFRTIDPVGKDHRFFFDTLGRTVKTVANYTGTGTVSSSTPDQNVTVEYT